MVSTVVARVLEKPGGLAGLDEPRPYLMRSVINEARSRLRSRRRWRMQSLDPVSDVPRVDYRDELVDVVGKLSVQQRAATFLVYWEGHTPTSAAELMGCRPATVRRYLHLARKRLKKVLDE